MWYIYPLLGNDRETNNEKTAVARQETACNSGSTAGSGVSYVVRSEAILLNLVQKFLLTNRDLVLFLGNILVNSGSLESETVKCGHESRGTLT
jgi:hypothetical protein